MDLKKNTVKSLEGEYFFNTYGRSPEVNILIEKGEGCWVWDDAGNKYLDFVSGLGVNSLGHCHPAVVEAVKDQAGKLLHTSNLYYTEQQVNLAAYLVDNSFGQRVFLGNSGAEANEAALKLARKYNQQEYGYHKYKVITAGRSFHGRTLATMAATAQNRYHKGFHPLLSGFNYASFNSIGSFEQLVDEETCAIMIEPVQGEAGVYPAAPDFLRQLRDLCNRKNLLLIFDEVQCGMGRTGHLWAYEDYGVEPDIMTAAKALGGGLPIGAMIAGEDLASGLGPGDHASTFGGNPLVCRGAIAVMQTMLQEGFLEEVIRKGEILRGYLEELQREYNSSIKEVRGKGLIQALEFNEPCVSQIKNNCQEKGLLINTIGENIIRFLPPLIVEEQEIEYFCSVFRNSLENL